MTSFVHVDYPQQHPGVVRAERVWARAQAFGRGLSASRGAAAMLLAAIVSALLVVANQVVETWTEGHLLAAWIVMWTVGFSALGLLAGATRRGVLGLSSALKRYSAYRRALRQDRQLWDIALSDARVMAD